MDGEEVLDEELVDGEAGRRWKLEGVQGGCGCGKWTRMSKEDEEVESGRGGQKRTRRSKVDEEVESGRGGQKRTRMWKVDEEEVGGRGRGKWHRGSRICRRRKWTVETEGEGSGFAPPIAGRIPNWYR